MPGGANPEKSKIMSSGGLPPPQLAAVRDINRTASRGILIVRRFYGLDAGRESARSNEP